MDNLTTEEVIIALISNQWKLASGYSGWNKVSNMLKGATLMSVINDLPGDDSELTKDLTFIGEIAFNKSLAALIRDM